MNLLYFIRLLLKNIVLLIVMPLVFVVIVFLLTQNQPKVYNSNATVYTGIATGSSIVSLEESKLDLFGTRTAFDNFINIVKSRNTIEEVGLRLFTSHMMLTEQRDDIISKKSYNDLMRVVPLEVKKLVVKNDFDKTYQNFKDYKNSSHKNFIYELINYNHPDYSSKKLLSKIKVSRIQSSDLVSIQYESDDPGICQNTLEVLISVFTTEYSTIKANQSDAVVGYFQSQLDVSNERLSMAERELLNFNQSNSIINYYEQTKHIASEKEHFDLTFQNIKMQNAAAQSVLKILEGKMTANQKMRVNSDDMVAVRKKLASVNLAISMKNYAIQMDSLGEKALINEISDLQTQAYELQEQLHHLIEEQYSFDNSPEGVSSSSILEDWLDKVIEMESTRAQLKVGNEKNKEFVDIFEDYAPLGATMKRLERKINVAEREYLSLLQSLNLAKLKQQNIALNSNLKIVAAPFYPIEAQASKRKFLLVIAFMIGLIIPAFGIILLDFLDQNIKNVYRAESSIGLKVAAIFPKLIHNHSLDLEFVTQKGLDVIARRLILNSDNKKQERKSDVNLIFSVLEGEGKTTIATKLLNRLSDYGYRILLFVPDTIFDEIRFDVKRYRVTNGFHRVENIEDLEADTQNIDWNSYDYIFIEIPGILNNSYPISLFKNSDHSFMVTRANRAWSKADANALSDILELTNDNHPQIILNGVDLEEMETVIGDLPRKRTFIRRFVKNVLRLQFFSKAKLFSNPKQAIGSQKDIDWKKIIVISIIGVVLLGIIAIGILFVYPKIKSRMQSPDYKEVVRNVEVRAVASDEVNFVIPDVLVENVEEESLFTEKPVASVHVPAEAKVVQTSINPPVNGPVSGFYVMGGTFGSIKNTNEFYNKLNSMGYQPYRFPPKNNTYSIAIGIYHSRLEAEIATKEYLIKVPRSGVWIKEIR